MGLAPTPKEMASRRRLKEETAERVVEPDEETQIETIHGNFRNASDPFVVEWLQTVYGLHWQYQKRHLDLMEMLCHDDRQWTTVRRVAMDVINEEWKAIEAYLRQSIAGMEVMETPSNGKEQA
jgi:hypothetical protein